MSEKNTPTTFLSQIHQVFDELKQTFLPVAAAMGDLDQDYLPRDEAFWEGILASLSAIQQASEACLTLTDDTRLPLSSPIPDAAYAAMVKEHVLVCHMRSRIEEVGVQLTAYRDRSSLAQKHLRQRQCILLALRDLYWAGQGALKQSRIWQDEIQRHLYLSRIPSANVTRFIVRPQFSQRAGKAARDRKRRTQSNSKGNRGTIVHFAPRAERREDHPDTDQR